MILEIHALVDLPLKKFALATPIAKVYYLPQEVAYHPVVQVLFLIAFAGLRLKRLANRTNFALIFLLRLAIVSVLNL